MDQRLSPLVALISLALTGSICFILFSETPPVQVSALAMSLAMHLVVAGYLLAQAKAELTSRKASCSSVILWTAPAWLVAFSVLEAMNQNRSYFSEAVLNATPYVWASHVLLMCLALFFCVIVGFINMIFVGGVLYDSAVNWLNRKAPENSYSA